ncbi:MAG: hypothetical protein ABL932_23045, partial [Terricaulis sp.]
MNASATLLAWSTPGGGQEVEPSPTASSDFVRLCRDLVRIGGEGVQEQQDPVVGRITWAATQRFEQGQRSLLFAQSDDRISHQSLRTLAASAASAMTTRADLDAMRMTSSLMT